MSSAEIEKDEIESILRRLTGARMALTGESFSNDASCITAIYLLDEVIKEIEEKLEEYTRVIAVQAEQIARVRQRCDIYDAAIEPDGTTALVPARWAGADFRLALDGHTGTQCVE